LGLVQEVVDQVNQLAGGIGNFGNHFGKGFYIEICGRISETLGRRAGRVGTVPCG
jgi:hypothetical protein